MSFVVGGVKQELNEHDVCGASQFVGRDSLRVAPRLRKEGDDLVLLGDLGKIVVNR